MNDMLLDNFLVIVHGLDQRWCGLGAPIGFHRSGEEGEQMTLLLGTGSADSQDALNKAVTLGAVRAKTAFAPQHGWTQRLLGRIHPEGTRLVQPPQRAQTSRARPSAPAIPD